MTTKVTPSRECGLKPEMTLVWDDLAESLPHGSVD